MNTRNTLALIMLPVIMAILFLDLGIHIVDYFIGSGSFSDTALWTLIGSFTGAIVSFTLLVIWDKHKTQQSNTQKDEMILNNIAHELEACLFACSLCVDHLQRDHQRMEEHARKLGTPGIPPPPNIRLNIWELLKYHVPKYIKNNMGKLVALRKAENRVRHFNDKLRSRIEYQNLGIGHDAGSYSKNISSFDEALIDILSSEIMPMIVDLRDEFMQFSEEVKNDRITVIFSPVDEGSN